MAEHVTTEITSSLDSLNLLLLNQGLVSYSKYPDVTHVPSLYKWQKMYVLQTTTKITSSLDSLKVAV
jgi:hypothetical protein